MHFFLQLNLAIGNTRDQIRKEITEKLTNMVRETMEASLEDHTEFDKDTSVFYDPQVQQKWSEDVRTRLSEQDDFKNCFFILPLIFR